MGVLKNPFLILMSCLLERFLYWRANQIVVNSPAYRSYLLGKNINPAKVTLIPNGVDASMFHPDDTGEGIRSRLGLNGCFVVTYTGALGLANDIPTVLGAAELLLDQEGIRFLLVGDGKERENLERLAEKKGLSNVIFLGSRPKSEMPDVLAASDACVAVLQNIPMFRTTYPNKVFDYMAAGRPTILAIDGVIRDVVEAAAGGVFVPPGDATALAEAVRSLAGNRAMAKEMGTSARSYVVKHFNRQDQAAAFLSLVTNLSCF